MSILKELVESASGGATAAHSIAGFRTLFGGMQKRTKKKKKKGVEGTKSGPVGGVLSFKYFMEADDSQFQSSDVITKLKNSEREAEQEGENTTAFALEDEKGNIVKVWVPDEQADDFMTALEQSLNDVDEDEDDQNEGSEIAEVLWNLRNDFDIINVEWSDIEEDQEEQLPTDVEEAPPAGGEANAEGGVEEPTNPNGEGGAGDEMTAEPGDAEDLGVGGEDEAKTALQNVIDMMKADAEARKSEAEARSAEAKAREAEAGMKVAQDKVKQEEKILDMEAYYDKEKKEKDETDRLAKLAKYQHDLAADNGMGPGSEEATPEAPPSIPEPPEASFGGEPEEDEERSMHVGHGGDTFMSKAELGELVLKMLRR